MTTPFARIALVAAAAALFVAPSARAADRVSIVVGPAVAPLEKAAAEQAAEQFQKLFGVETTIGDSVPADAGPLVLIGSPDSNPAVDELLAGIWPRVSDQGIVLKSFDHNGRKGLVLGGGSPAATYWSVCEFGYRQGLRFLLRGDVFPQETQPLKLDGHDVVLEPALRVRTWQTVGNLPIGPESWSVADQRQLFVQLAKMKFNRVLLSVSAWQPFVDYKFRGVQKETGELWYGERFPVGGDTPGKVAFQGAEVFENPDFAGKSTYEQRTKAGIAHLRGLIDAAHAAGLSVELSICPLEFPPELAGALPGLRVSQGLRDRGAVPGPEQNPLDPALKELSRTVVRAYLDTYPNLDALCLRLSEHAEWEQQAEGAWEQLSRDRDLAGQSLAQVLSAAEKRPLSASGKLGERAARNSVASLAFLNALTQDESLLARKDGGRVALTIAGVDPALYPLLDRVLPAGAGALHTIDNTARRAAENRSLLAQVPAEKVPSRLVLALADDRVGILPQSSTQSVALLAGELARLKWEGFSARCWIVGEQDPAAHYLSRAAFEPGLSPRQAHDGLFVALTGKQAASDRLWRSFDQVEKATELIDRNDLGFAMPAPGMMMKHYASDPAPSWWKEMTAHYVESSNELYRSHDAADPRSRRLLFYLAKRSEYVLEYLAAVDAVRAAGIAAKKNDAEALLTQLETAVEQLYNSLDTLSDVARDQSDRGLIALLAEYAFRPLARQAERAADGESLEK